VLHTMVQRRPYPKQLELMDYMAHHGCDLEDRDSLGQTPFFIAASQGRTDLMKDLVHMEADVRLRVLVPLAFCVSPHLLRVFPVRVTR
jgi:ankyrin repeat protein